MAIFSVTLPNGVVFQGNAYLIDQPKANVFILTGMQEYSARYATFAHFLNQHGYNVHVLDHQGQGENAGSIEAQQRWKKGNWDWTLEALHVEANVLKREGKPVILMGHSMGSFFVQSYLEHYPLSVDKSIIMGSNGPGMPYGLAKFLSAITTTKKNWDKPSKFINKMAVGGYHVKDEKTPLDWLSYNEENVQNYIADPYCGYPNTCGFYHEFMAGMATLYQKKNIKKISPEEHILLVSGEEDPVGGCGKGVKKLYAMYQKCGVKDVTMRLYPHMRHEILNEKNNEAVLQDILTFID
jgi:alpha-beta hydrolase superfamily lysophospholipase